MATWTIHEEFAREHARMKRSTEDGSMSHTPVPWSHEPADGGQRPMPAALLGADGSTIAEAVYELEDDGPRREMDFALIARAVNVHNELLAALEVLVAVEGGAWHVERYARERQEALEEARAVIAKARGVVPK